MPVLAVTFTASAALDGVVRGICGGVSYTGSINTSYYSSTGNTKLTALSVIGSKTQIRRWQRVLEKETKPVQILTGQWSDGEVLESSNGENIGKNQVLGLKLVGGMHSWIAQIDKENWHLLATVDTSATDVSEDEPVYALIEDETAAQALVRRLRETRQVPLLDEWADPLYQAMLAEDHIQLWNTLLKSPEGMTITASSQVVTELISQMLQRGVISVPAGVDAPSVDLDTLHQMDSYLLTFGKAFGQKILDTTPALHDPGTAAIDRGLLRRPFQAQADGIEAITKTWASGQKTVWGIGEQGVGKTLIGLAAAYESLGGKPGRILVHAPTHLVAKWCRESRNTLPGVVVREIRSWRQAKGLVEELKHEPTSVEVWVLGRDMSKLGWTQRPAARRAPERLRREGAFWVCPDCGKPLCRVFADKNRHPEYFPKDAFDKPGALNAKCPACDAWLWEADREGVRRISPSWYWNKYLRPGTFDVLLADEIHEEKGDSEQGRSVGMLHRLSKRALMLTGTLLGGKASDLHYHMARTNASQMQRFGIEYSNPTPFVQTYGTSESRQRRNTQTNKTSVSVSEKPGVHPQLYLDFLIGNAIFIDLADLAAGLPPYTEEVVEVELDPLQAQMIEDVIGGIKTHAQTAIKGGRRAALGGYMQASLAYPDWVWANKPIIDSAGTVLAQTQIQWDPDQMLPKEANIVATCLREVYSGRRCAIYVNYTNKYDMSERLREQLEAVGLRVAVLKASVPPEAREKWIADKTKQGTQVLICHPKLVATGLDLTGESNYPTIIWAQTDWSLFTLRQASRRSWRIGQTMPVKVIYMSYANTMQSVCLQVLAEKLLAAEAIEGRFSIEGLQALSSGTNPMLRLANALVYGLSDLPDLGQAWKQSRVDASQLVLEAAQAAVVPETPVAEALADIIVEAPSVVEQVTLATAAVAAQPKASPAISAEQMIAEALAAASSPAVQSTPTTLKDMARRRMRRALDPNQLTLWEQSA